MLRAHGDAEARIDCTTVISIEEWNGLSGIFGDPAPALPPSPQIRYFEMLGSIRSTYPAMSGTAERRLMLALRIRNPCSYMHDDVVASSRYPQSWIIV